MKSTKRCRAAAVISGLVLAPVVLAPTDAAAAESSVASTDAAPGCSPPRVTGISALLDAFSTGSAAGPSVLFGVALAALSQPLPEPLGSVQTEFLAQSAQGVQSMRTEAPKQIDDLRAVIAPFSTGNEVGDQGVDAFADGLDALADRGGKAIAPGDVTLRQLAVLVRLAREEPPKPC